MSHVIIDGRLGADPELKYTPAGKAVASCSVAETKRSKDASGQWADDGTTWYRVTVWERAAEALAEAARKGDRVLVHGELHAREYTDRNGTARLSLDVNARTVAVVPRQGAARAQAAPAHDEWSTSSADVPF